MHVQVQQQFRHQLDGAVDVCCVVLKVADGEILQGDNVFDNRHAVVDTVIYAGGRQFDGPLVDGQRAVDVRSFECTLHAQGSAYGAFKPVGHCGEEGLQGNHGQAVGGQVEVQLHGILHGQHAAVQGQGRIVAGLCGHVDIQSAVVGLLVSLYLQVAQWHLVHRETAHL